MVLINNGARQEKGNPPDAAKVAVNWIVKVARSLVQALTDPYRPELHYMRGPGPKWRTKHPAVG